MRFNVIGHITSETGLGVMACDLIRALHDLGHGVIGFDVDPGLQRAGRSQAMAPFMRPAAGMFRNGIDVVVFPLSAVDHWSRSYIFGTRRVAVPLWELPDINAAWLHGLLRFDGVVSSSDFIYEALTAAGAAVWRGQHPHYIQPIGQTAPTADREKFGLPADQVVFTFAFDPSSDLQRKNPAAIVDAFLQAEAPNSLLCIQVNKSVEAFGALDRWLSELPTERVKVINRHLAHDEAVQLIASSDVYISLHRAEGFGLGMHEAMQLGKPVIATAWSGNMSYMDAESACLVDADLIELNGKIPAYTESVIGQKSTWADPSLYEASIWIEALAGDADLRAKMGAAAIQKAGQYQSQARRLDWLEHLEQMPVSSARSRGMKTLIFTPTWIDAETGDDVIMPEVEEAIKAQRCVDFDWHVTTDNPYPIGSHANVMHQYRQAREYFLQGTWDALLTIEHDNLLPDDEAVARLVDTPGDVVYAPYLLRHGMLVLSTWQYVNDRNLGMTLSGYKRELREAREQVVHRVSGAGFGCTLMRRRVLEALEFRGGSQHDSNECPDLRFATDCLRAGFVANGRFDVPVLHWNEDRWLHPFQSRKNTVSKYIALQTMSALVDGRSVRLVQGEEIELTRAEALDLLRAGYLRDAPAAAPEVERAVAGPSERAVTAAQARKARRKAADAAGAEEA